MISNDRKNKAISLLKHHLGGVVSTQQFRTARGMLRSNNEEAQISAIRFIVSSMYIAYPTAKDRFCFLHCEDGYNQGWSIVDTL